MTMSLSSVKRQVSIKVTSKYYFLSSIMQFHDVKAIGQWFPNFKFNLFQKKYLDYV